MEDSIPLWSKRCTKCGEVKDLELFHKRGKARYASWCKLCQYTYNPKHPHKAYKTIAANSVETGMKTCANCGETKPLTISFYRKATSRDGRDPWCKSCRKIHDRTMLENRYRELGRTGPRKYVPRTDGMKVCSSCGEEKSIDNFHKQDTSSDGLYSQCRSCCSIKRRSPQNRISQRKQRLAKRYQLTDEEYNTMLEAQGGVCAICKQPEVIYDKRLSRVRRLAIDHDHKTGKVRALLCACCNRAYGYMKEDPERIKALLAYAEKWQTD